MGNFFKKNTSDAKQKPIEGSLDFILDEIRARINSQLTNADSVANKFNFLLALNGILAAAITAFVIEKQDCSSWLKFSVFLFMLAIAVLVYGIKLNNYRRDPDPRTFYSKYVDVPIHKTKETLAAHFIDCFEYNQAVILKINRIFLDGWLLTIFGLFVLLILLFAPEAQSLWLILKTTIQNQ